MHFLLIPLLALLSLFRSDTSGYTQLIEHVQASIVRITGQVGAKGQVVGDFVCSGEVVREDLVLTAAHCTHTDFPIYADGVHVKVLKVDSFTDLAVLQVSTSRPVLAMREAGVTRFEPLSALGYAYGLPRLSVLTVRPFLVNEPSPFEPYDATAPGIVVQPAYIGGMSGGPVIDQDGLMVGIVQQGYEGVGYGVGTLVIRAFLLGV